MSIFPVFFNECKILDNNIDNMLLVAVSAIYATNVCMLFSWLVNFPPIFGCTKSWVFLHLAGFLYVCLFLALPLISLNLFTAEPEISDSHLFKLLPWKPLSHVPPIA